MTNDRRIVLVEDTLTQAMLYQHMLEKGGFEVRLARSGKQALEHVDKDKPRAILTDINMPEMTGYDLCKTLKSSDTTGDIIVVLLTTTFTPDMIFQCINSGADGIALKGLPDSVFVELMQRTVERRFENGGASDSQFQTKIEQSGAAHEISCGKAQTLNLLFSLYDLLSKVQDNK